MISRLTRARAATLCDIAASNVMLGMTGSRALREAAIGLGIENSPTHGAARLAYSFVPFTGAWADRNVAAELADAALILREGWTPGDDLSAWSGKEAP